MGRGAGIVTPMERGLPIVQLAGPSSGRPPISRSADRRVTAAGLTAAGTFLAAAVLATLLPDAARRGTWLPLHLALAGGAGTAIASMMPFFAAALAAAAPVDARLRSAAIGAVAIGALLATLGVVAGAGAVAVLGGLAYLAGLAGVGWATFAPLRRGLGPRGGIVAVAYGAGLAQLAAGVALGTATVGGAAIVVADWPWLRPAHAWLNVLGCISLVVAGTLLHFLPTVLGCRIRRRRSATPLVAALAVAAPVVAAGYALRWDALVRAGGLLELAGAVALVGYVAGCIADRGHWTTDAGWHRMAAGHLLAAVAWFTVGVAVVAGRAVVDGADPGGWSAAWAIGPLVVGWAVQAVLGAAGHIVPAIGPGDASRHARQRQLLGTAATARLVTFQLGVAALAVGLPTGAEAVVVVGLIAAGATILATLGLLGWAMIAGAAAESDPLLAHRKAA